MNATLHEVLRGIKSPPLSRIAIGLTLLELLALLGYIALFVDASLDMSLIRALFLDSPDATFPADWPIDHAIVDVRRIMLPAIPMLLLLHFFVLGLWVHAIYADAFGLFENKDLNPQRAMMLVIIPGLNIYGFGKALSRIAFAADHDRKDPFMKKYNSVMKFGLVVFYASIAGILFSLYYSINVPFDAARLAGDYFAFFNYLQFALVGGSICGAGAAVLGCQKVISYKWRLESTKVLN